MAEFTTGYPILLNLTDKQVVVIGGGSIATRKVKHLLAASARVLIISPDVTRELQERIDTQQVEWVQAPYQRDMLNPYMPLLVIATTNNSRVNQTVAQDAHRIRAWVNVADGSREESDFSNMAVLNRPPLTVALSSSGASPVLLGQLKSEISSAIGDEYAILADWLGQIRQPTKSEIDTQPERQRLYQQVLESDVLLFLQQGKKEEAWQAFQQIVRERTSR